MTTYNILTLFPEMFDSILSSSIWGRAREAKLIEVNTIDIRGYTKDKHRRADDYPFGGGSGMVLKPDPVHACFKDVGSRCSRPYINVYMSPRGKQLKHNVVISLLEYSCINILCGHYEGVDERVLQADIDMEISIGDFILTGGEIAAMALIDSCIRHIEGVLGNSDSVKSESFSETLLEHPQYTRPPEFEGIAVPETLLSGHHGNVDMYLRRMSILETAKRRPDLIPKTVFNKKDIEYITGK
jgi:tRNA (guanine37-N1)-methyltransferase